MIHYSSEMIEQDSLWEIEKEDLGKMKVLFENIMIEAKSLGFSGTWVIYDGNSESIIDVFKDEKHQEECNLGTEEPLGSFGYCKPLIKFLKDYICPSKPNIECIAYGSGQEGNFYVQSCCNKEHMGQSCDCISYGESFTESEAEKLANKIGTKLKVPTQKW